MKIELDFRSGQPIYLQIVEQVRRQIASGELQVGEQLPTVRQLATELRVNFNTIARAYRLLDEAGLISTQHGRGTYVWEKPTGEQTMLLRKQTLREQIETFIESLHRLGYSPVEIEEEYLQSLSDRKEKNNEI